MIDSSLTVAEIATAHPETIRVFQRVGIDFCCGGRQSLQQACDKKGLSLQETLHLLAAEPARNGDDKPHGEGESLEDLIKFLVDTHHAFTRDELSRLEPLVSKVASVHGDNHPHLLELKALFGTLRDDLMPHMMKEEHVLFPYIVKSERAKKQGAELPVICSHGIDGPISMMQMEHEQTGDILHRMREITNGYTPPLDACTSFRALYRGLSDLEADLHRHIHLENNVLFVSAREM